MRIFTVVFGLVFVLMIATAAQADVLISEIGPSNHCTYFAEDGSTPDWIELYNSGDEDMLLDGWALSDGESGNHSMLLDGMSLPAGAYCLVEINGKAGFGLSASGETVCLLLGGVTQQQVTYPALDDDASFALLQGGYAVTWLPTPGMENIALGRDDCFQPDDSVRFNEFLTSAAPYRDTEGYDYVELINPGKDTALSGWQLRLGMAGSKRFNLPDKTLEQGKYLTVYCTDDDTKKTHSGFNLPAQGALISLWRPDGTLADFFRLPIQYPNIAYGLSRDLSEWGYLAEHSYGRRNGTVYAEQMKAPVFSLSGGVYQAPFVTVKITSPEGGQIRYTLDGSMPTEKSKLYTEPLTLDKTVSLRAAAFQEERLHSPDTAATYVLGLDQQFPVICLIIDPYYLNDGKDGLIKGVTDGKGNWKFDWEYPAHFEYFDETGHSLISQACGFGIQGDSSRGQNQKAFKLIARKAYGTGGVFDFNPFTDRAFTSYKAFNLRAAGSEGSINARFRDACLSTLAEGTSLLYSAGQPALVYLNGEIYGHYNLRERINKYFIAQHTGLTDDDLIDRIDILSETGDLVHNGSSADYKALSNFMKKNDLNIPENLEYVLSQMDVQSYFEYVAFMMTTANKDLSNSRFYRVPGGKWTWLLYDLDRAMERPELESAFWLYALDIHHELALLTDHVPFAALMKVPAMRERFFLTLGDILYIRFSPESLIALIDAWHDKVAPIMPYQLKRWTTDSIRYWETLVEKMRDCARERPAYVISLSQRYFHLTDEEVQRYFGAYLSNRDVNE